MKQEEQEPAKAIPFDDLVKDRLSSYFNEDMRSSRARLNSGLFETTELKKKRQIAPGQIHFAS